MFGQAINTMVWLPVTIPSFQWQAKKIVERTKTFNCMVAMGNGDNPQPIMGAKGITFLSCFFSKHVYMCPKGATPKDVLG